MMCSGAYEIAGDCVCVRLLTVGNWNIAVNLDGILSLLINSVFWFLI